ncbi:hypothetical protein NDU88_000663 [Pleurodeles waltl]|uniref:Uncharacterized protein n=1 Tax=Pleurodeles waltl TaxID=8319 RepID=A0AAV7S588_PLEWA|nr:hypothetical protein NDU88_000663 [Pleurodeles waltl]
MRKFFTGSLKSEKLSTTVVPRSSDPIKRSPDSGAQSHCLDTYGETIMRREQQFILKRNREHANGEGPGVNLRRHARAKGKQGFLRWPAVWKHNLERRQAAAGMREMR